MAIYLGLPSLPSPTRLLSDLFILTPIPPKIRLIVGLVFCRLTMFRGESEAYRPENACD